VVRNVAGRFALVGVANTAIDFLLFALLTTVGLGVIAANTLSTTAGMAFSFVANRSFSFRSASSWRTTIVPFLAVSLTALWVIHPLVILGATALLTRLGLTETTAVLLGKVAAIAVGLVWNFTWYRRVVFTDREPTR
jgi:putative flippase GtrA